jgi:hypothetical protein
MPAIFTQQSAKEQQLRERRREIDARRQVNAQSVKHNIIAYAWTAVQAKQKDSDHPSQALPVSVHYDEVSSRPRRNCAYQQASLDRLNDTLQAKHWSVQQWRS